MSSPFADDGSELGLRIQRKRVHTKSREILLFLSIGTILVNGMHNERWLDRCRGPKAWVDPIRRLNSDQSCIEYPWTIPLYFTSYETIRNGANTCTPISLDGCTKESKGPHLRNGSGIKSFQREEHMNISDRMITGDIGIPSVRCISTARGNNVSLFLHKWLGRKGNGERPLLGRNLLRSLWKWGHMRNISWLRCEVTLPYGNFFFSQKPIQVKWILESGCDSINVKAKISKLMLLTSQLNGTNSITCGNKIGDHSAQRTQNMCMLLTRATGCQPRWIQQGLSERVSTKKLLASREHILKTEN